MMDFLMENAPTIATLFFFFTFCYIVLTVFKKGAKKKFDKYSQIPLKDEDHV
jgi:cbb3-type cytochrome oxidase subunit 3